MKYLVCPGYIFSANDGQRHYISADQLIQLYGVKRKDCRIIARQSDIYTLKKENYIQLHPRYDGNYTIPKQEKKK